MFKFLFVAFFFFMLLLFLMGFSVVRTFKTLLFGKDTNADKQKQQRKTSSSSRQRTDGTNSNASYEAPRKKIIAEDEGEYVDYEEVKTDNTPS